MHPRLSLDPFASFSYPEYRAYFVVVILSGLASQGFVVAIGWTALQLSDSPFFLGLVTGARALPFIFASPPGGLAADRYSRRSLLIGNSAVSAVVLLSAWFIAQSGLLAAWHVVVLALVIGSLQAFIRPVRHAMLPGLVDRPALLNAIALQSTGGNLTGVIAPVLTGLTMAAWGAPAALLLLASFYAASTLAAVRLRLEAGRWIGRVQSARRDVADAYRYLTGNPVVLSLIALGFVPIVVATPYRALLPVYARDTLGLDEAGYGLLTSVAAVGSLIATFAIAATRELRWKGHILLAHLAGSGAALLLLSLSNAFGPAVAILFILGATEVGFIAFNNLLIQEIVPDDLRGRMMSLTTVEQGSQPLGSIIFGALAQATSVVPTFAVMGGLCLASAAAAWRFLRGVREL